MRPPLRFALCVSLMPGTTAAPSGGVDQQATFRSRAEVVTVDVSVRRGNRPVASLTAADFRLFDNDVEQQVDWARADTVPIDVTLIVDVSGSTAGALDGFRQDIVEIASLLRPVDRLQLLSFSNEVELVFPLQPATARPPVEQLETSRFTSANDAAIIGLLQRPTLDRRRLAVMFTDGHDTISRLPAETVESVAAGSETVFHVVWAGTGGGRRDSMAFVPAPLSGLAENARQALETAAETTGGRTHGTGIFRRSLVGPFTRIFDEMRASYVLRYSPRGVEPGGWHSIRVEVVGNDDLDIRARRGYFGG